MSSVEQQNNKRIAKNTLLLYFRMLITMAVGLYTSRVILQNLGVEDFGIYNVVGGVVAMFSILSGSLSAAISRFLTFELGKKDRDKLAKIFSSAITIQMLLSLIVVLVAEPIGLWFLYNKMNIPIDRLEAANWVFQLSLLTFCINLISVPYNAAIVAHEKMSAFAYVSILEAAAKLCVAWAIIVSPMDRLEFYALLMCLVALLVRFVYGWYCKKHFEECKFHFLFDKTLLRQMFGFAGWNFVGASSTILRDHGNNIILNLFYGPMVNAARGISIQVNHTISLFMSNFLTAVNPQITKSYATGNKEYMIKLAFTSARFAFYLLILLSLPILMNTEYVLRIWLKSFPEHTVLFIQLNLVWLLCESISLPLMTMALATGRIKYYQIIVGGLQMMNLPISYVFLRKGFPPEVIMVVAIVIAVLCLIARLLVLRKLIGLDLKSFFVGVVCKVVLVSVFAGALVVFIGKNWECSSVFDFSIQTSCYCLMSLCVIFFIGCRASERQWLILKIRQVMKRF